MPWFWFVLHPPILCFTQQHKIKYSDTVNFTLPLPFLTKPNVHKKCVLHPHLAGASCHFGGDSCGLAGASRHLGGASCDFGGDSCGLAGVSCRFGCDSCDFGGVSCH